MRANKNIFESSLKIAKEFSKELDNVPDLFDSVLKDVIPNVSTEDKIKLQKLVKESNKLIEEAKKDGDFLKIKQSIDELTLKHGRNNNT